MDLELTTSVVEYMPQIGDTFTNPKMAAAYEKIAEEGPDGFYKGSVAENIVKALVNSKFTTNRLIDF